MNNLWNHRFTWKNLDWRKVFFSFIGILVLWGIIHNLNLLDGEFIIGNEIAPPAVYNAKPLISESKYQFIYPNDQEPKNWASTTFNDQTWLPYELGKQELKTLPAFKEKSGIILHRFRLRVPMPLFELGQPIALHIPYVIYSRYQVFINGSPISDDPGLVYPFNTPLISIPKGVIGNNLELVVGIRGEFKPGDIGIAYKAMPMLGIKSEFHNLYVENERIDNSYYNVIMALKAGFLLFFIILFLVTNSQRFMIFFLLYASCNTIATAFIIEWIENYVTLNFRAFCMFNLQLIGYIALWFFVEALYETRVKIQRGLMGIQLLVLNLLLAFFHLTKFGIDLESIFNFHYMALSEILFAITLLAFLEFQKKPNQNIANLKTKTLALIFSVYFGIFTWLHYFGSKYSNNSHHPVDILFFIFVGFLAASEFLLNQLKATELAKALNSQINDVELGKSAARIAHDIRKPFSNLKIALETIRKSEFDSEVIESVFSQVSNTIEYGEELASQILDSKRSDIQQMKPCSAETILNRFRHFQGDQLENLNIDLQIKVISKKSFLGDEAMVLALLQNIVNNAVEAFENQAEKTITITFTDFRDSIGNWKCKLTIENNGPKIPRTVLEKLFKSSVTYGKANGTGIGLTGVKAQVDKMNAEISVYNLQTAPGVAFEVRFLTAEFPLPRAHQPTVPTIELSTKDVTLFKPVLPKVIEKIIVVDDDELIQMAWKMAWPDPGLYIFETPEQVFALLETDPKFFSEIDLLITDQYFGSKSQMTGVDLFKALKGFGFDRIALCSGSEENSELENIGFLKILEKQILTKAQISTLFFEEGTHD